MNKKENLLSIIVPIYGTEKYLPKCLDSLVGQSYENIEIICVDDCSPGKAEKICKKYMKEFDCIKYIKNKVNLGLFKSRLVGSDIAKGDYICFVDSDDYVSIDGYRNLLLVAEENSTEIISGTTIMNDENLNEIYIHPRNVFCDWKLEKKKIQKKFFEQQGLQYCWHTIWNKIYHKNLWNRSRPYFDHLKGHTIMAEDLAFSVVLFSFANTFEYVETDLIFYTQRKDASTSLKSSFPKLKKNINDLSKVFKFAERFLISNKFNQYLEDLKEWKKLYSRFWFDNIEQGKVNYIFKNKLKKLLLNSLELKDKEGTKVYDHYHYFVRSKWYDYGEKLKKEIISDETRIISFDIFDTLIERPFLNPHTLFDFLEIEFSYKDKRFAGGWFKKLRIESEKEVREEIWRNGLSIEEVTLDQIYDEISKRGISKELSEKIKEKEIELELKYCRKRNYAKELYELAIYKNKKTVVTSDMYLPKSVINQILEKNGYSHISDVFLSADIGLTKSTGNLFKYALKKLKISPKNFMHIGDNWESDVQSAKNQKIRWHVLFPKASDLLFNNLKDHYGDSLKGLKEFSGRWINYLYLAEHSLILNCCLGLIANKYFSNPYRSFCIWSDFNSDPLFIGYSALGMHKLALSLWLIENCRNASNKKLHFVARDGFTIQESFEKLTNLFNLDIKSNYLYLSRKSLIPALIEKWEDLYFLSNYINVNKLSPKEFLKLILKVPEEKIDSKLFFKKGLNPNKPFEKWFTYKVFIDVLKNEPFYFSFLTDYKNLINKYLEQVKNKDAIFDIGYNGTTQYILKKFKKIVDGYYIHTNTDKPYNLGKNFKFSIKTFFDYSPAISGAVREHIFSKTEGSCISYKEIMNKVEPELEKEKTNFSEKNSIDLIQKYSNDFINDLVENFGEYIEKMHFKNSELSYQFEYFLNSSRNDDKLIFNTSSFEDDLDQAYENKTLYDIWIEDAQNKKLNGENIQYINTHPKDFGIFKKAIYYLLVDWKLFLRLFKNKSKRKIVRFKEKILKR